MSLIRVSNGRLYSFDETLGLIVHADELALMEASGATGVAISISGTIPGSGESAALTMSPDGRLRVDTHSSDEDAYGFGGDVWAAESAFFSRSAW